MLGKVRTQLEWAIELLSKMLGDWVDGWIPLKLSCLLEHLYGAKKQKVSIGFWAEVKDVVLI